MCHLATKGLTEHAPHVCNVYSTRAGVTQHEGQHMHSTCFSHRSLVVQEGYGEFQVYHDNGERADMYRQYLKPVQKRDNLTLLTKTRTLKVVLEKRGSRQAARGVQFNSTGPDGIYHTGKLQLGSRQAASCMHILPCKVLVLFMTLCMSPP